MPTTNQLIVPEGVARALSPGLGEIASNQNVIGAYPGFLNWVNQSVSWTSTAGLNVTNRTVPANRWWLVQTVRLVSAEVSKYYEFYADDGSVSHMCFHDSQVTLPATASDPVGHHFPWPGLVLPAGWRFGVKIDGAAGSLASNWQYSALEIAMDVH